MKTLFSLKFLPILIALTLVGTSCSKDNHPTLNNDNSPKTELTGSWKVLFYIEDGTLIPKTQENTWPQFNNGDISITFGQPDNSGIGSISGTAVTNQLAGEYSVISKSEISVSAGIRTFMGQPKWADLFEISSAKKYELKNSKLFIFLEDDNNVIVFERA